MAYISEVQMAQKSLEECVLKKMDELQAQLQSASTAKDTVAKVAVEFRTFRELTFNMLGLLRQQIQECAKAVDSLETRQRRKTLVFSGVPEAKEESCTAVMLGIIQGKLVLKDFTTSSIKDCHRLGTAKKDVHKPLLVKFTNYDFKAAVWRSKAKLKGSSSTVKEFLTRERQAVFVKARVHFGIRGCWTQDGIINIKATDGCRFKVVSMDELKPLLEKYPKLSTTNTK